MQMYHKSKNSSTAKQLSAINNNLTISAYNLKVRSILKKRFLLAFHAGLLKFVYAVGVNQKNIESVTMKCAINC